jgi:hypothetical protein
MNETPAPLTPEPSERYKVLIVVLTLITTVVTAIVATLQADANILANNANRDSQYYALLASGELHRSGLQSSYDLDIFAGILTETQTMLVNQLSSLQGGMTADDLVAKVSNINALAAQARAARLTSFSIFYTDPRYAPKTSDGSPDAQAYLADSSARANELVLKQNTASDDYHKYSSKADSYVGVLTVMAVAFFLLGLAQALMGRMRLVFAIFGALILMSASAWAFLILLF